MSSTASTVRWLPAAIARAAVVLHPAPAPAGPRHLAPNADDTVLRPVTAEAVTSTGRHAEHEWSRELFDPDRDEDPFEWLGFSAER